MSLEKLSQDDFEQMLLASASSDGPSAGASVRAWSQLVARAFGATDALASGSACGPRVAERRPAPFGTAVRWVAIGAVGGSLLTYTLATHRAAQRVPFSSTASGTTSEVGSPIALPSLRNSPEWEAAPNPMAEAPLSVHPRARALAQADSLAAEVAALDSVRTALDRGAPDQALLLVRSYLRTFPEGKLLPEAHVARIEALAASGDRAAATSEASRFLERYPTAPQRARIEALRARMTNVKIVP